MRKILWICVLALGVTLLQSPSASAQSVLRATLTGGEEAPTPVLTGAVGTARVYIDPTGELVVELRVFNLPTGTTASHIHVGAKGLAGPVVIDFPIGRGITGDTSLNFRVNDGPAFHPRPEIGINTWADAVQAVAGGNAYVNVHTTAFGGGEIRGQLAPSPD